MTRYIDRSWDKFSLADKIGILSFSVAGEGFWRSDSQRHLFDNLRRVRNALTHPGIFTSERVEEFDGLSGPAVSSCDRSYGKLRTGRNALACFAEDLEKLSGEDALKAVEIALRHAERFEGLFGRDGRGLFSRINDRTGAVESPTGGLAQMRKRHFDSIWSTAEGRNEQP